MLVTVGGAAGLSATPGWRCWSPASAMVVVSYVVVGVGPRTIGRQHPYAVGLAAAGPVRVLGRVLGPVAAAADPASATRSPPAAASARARSPPRSSCASWSTWPASAAWSRTASAEMIHSVFELGDTIAREVMVPRTEMVWIEQDKTRTPGHGAVPAQRLLAASR